MSNFGQVECLHNLGYWSGRPYLGLGPGAHSRLGLGEERIATVYICIYVLLYHCTRQFTINMVFLQVNFPAPASWLTAVENRGCGVIKERKVIDR